MLENLISHCNLSIIYDPVTSFVFEQDNIKSIILASGKEIKFKKIILTTGTFLNGVIHIGSQMTPAGRFGEAPTSGLSEQLQKFNLMFGTKLGASAESAMDLYLRPETAQGIFVNFLNVQKLHFLVPKTF